MSGVYYKNYGIWLGGAIALEWILAYAGALNFLYDLLEEFSMYIPWLFIIPGTILGTVMTHKALGKRIVFGRAVLPVILFITGSSVLGLVVFLVQSGGMEYGYFFFSYFFISLFSNLLIGISVLLAAGTWYMFEKAGKPGWAMLVPIYNLVVMCEIAKKPGWWVVLFIIPIVNVVFLIMMLHGISKNFGKSEGFTVGLVFLRQIFFAILGYGDAVYLGSQTQMNNDVIDDYRQDN